jgi:hypothetical protein
MLRYVCGVLIVIACTIFVSRAMSEPLAKHNLGQQCVATNPQDASQIYYGAIGVSALTAVSLNCPLTEAYPWYTGYNQLYVWFKDGSSSYPVQCNQRAVDTNLNQFSGPYRFSCSAAGGCVSNSNPAFTGANSLQFLYFGSPYYGLTNFSVDCWMPAPPNYSYIVYYEYTN